MATILLVPGSFHGAWCWLRLVPLLSARGIRVLAPDLPGTGGDPTPPGAVTLDLWARSVASHLAAAAEPVLLVGHSRGGVVVSQAAEHEPGRIKASVYLSGMLLPSGATILDGFEAIVAARSGLADPGEPQRAVVRSADGLSATCDPAAALPRFYSGTGEADRRFALDRLMPEPTRPWADRLRLTDSRYGSVPRLYVECLRDRAVPIGLQRRWASAEPCRQVLSLDADHSPFFSMPDALAGILAALA